MPMPDATGAWTLEELHRLPDDGNKYELVRGELFVTPPPSVRHESLLAVLSAPLTGYVTAHQIGRVYHPRSVVRAEGSELEPDLMVRPLLEPQSERREELPLPILVVEVLSGATRRRDHLQKRDFYMDAGIPEYWIVNLIDEQMEVHRNPSGRTYKERKVYRDAAEIKPLALPTAKLTPSMLFGGKDR